MWVDEITKECIDDIDISDLYLLSFLYDEFNLISYSIVNKTTKIILEKGKYSVIIHNYDVIIKQKNKVIYKNNNMENNLERVQKTIFELEKLKLKYLK
jgi:hypothetical protein